MNTATRQTRRLAASLKEFRRRAGLTQRELADLAGLSVAGVRDLEQGRITMPRAATMRRLVDALELSAADADELLRLSTAGPSVGSDLWIQVLGPLTVTSNGSEVDPGSARQRTLLGLLSLAPNLPVGRDTLIEAVWGINPPPAASDLLQSRMSRLRKRLADGADLDGQVSELIVASRGGYRLSVTEEQLDLLAFRRQAARARRARDAGELQRACTLFGEVGVLWRGSPLADIGAMQTHPAVVALVKEWQAVVVDYAEVAAELGSFEQVLPLLEGVTQADSLHEVAHANLMIALAGSGQQAAALTLFDDIRRRLSAELGADPGPELLAAHRRVLRQEIRRPEVAPIVAHRQLPPDIADFTGRQDELAELRLQLGVATDTGTATLITSIEGMAGIGKTRLAVHLAHELVASGRFADEQLYVDLRGHSELPPADPAVAIASFLRLLGVPASQIPRDLAGRTALYRDRLHDKAALVLLDNAASAEQVQPLLPGSPKNLVLITSRRALSLDGAHTIPLEAFTLSDAEALLAKIIGMDRLTADRQSAREVIELCGHLPLAVALAARRLQTRPAWGLADLVARLEEVGSRIGELSAGSRRVRTAFDLSYQALDEQARCAFRLLGVIPGEDFGVEAVAALVDTTTRQARLLLDHLVDEYLVTVVSGDRYRLHDLLREYAQQLCEQEEFADDRSAALRRLLDYYLHTTTRAAQVLQPHRWAPEPIGEPPESIPVLVDKGAAARWFGAECACLTPMIGLAISEGYAGHAWRFAHAMWVFVYLYGYTEDWEGTLRAVLAATEEAGDAEGIAVSRHYLGGALLHQNKLDEAADHLGAATKCYHELGLRELELGSLSWLGIACFRLGEFALAREYNDAALSLCDGSEPYREAIIRNNMGFLFATVGELDRAFEEYVHARELARQSGSVSVEAAVLVNVGDAHRQRGDLSAALDYLDQAETIARDHDLRPIEGSVRHRLANTYRDMGKLDQALRNLMIAVEEVRTVGMGGLATESEILVDLAIACHRNGDVDDAMTWADTAIDIVRATGERYQADRAIRLLVELSRERGNAERARLLAERARQLTERLGGVTLGEGVTSVTSPYLNPNGS